MTKYKLMPVEATPEMEQAAERYWNERRFKGLSNDPRTWKGVHTAMLSAGPVVNIVATKNEHGQIVSVTLQDEDHRILEVIAEADVQEEPLGYIRRSAIELMKRDELGVRANIIKEPRYPDCVAIYTAPHPAPDVAELVDALEEALNGSLLDEVNRDDDDIWTLCAPHLPDEHRNILRYKLARLDAALAAHRKQGVRVKP